MIFYNVFSYISLTDPQIYTLVHGFHHSKVNTWDDTEFHPLGKIKNVSLRRIYNLLEIILGVSFTFGLQMYILPRHPRYKKRYRASSQWVSFLMWILFYGGVGFLSAVVFDVGGLQVAAAFLITFWLGSFFIHTDQLIEHGRLIVDGDIRQRMIATRNLRGDRFAEKVLLFLLHGDCREHVLNHTLVPVYSRPFPAKVPMPEDAVYISLKDYAAILWLMVSKG